MPVREKKKLSQSLGRKAKPFQIRERDLERVLVSELLPRSASLEAGGSEVHCHLNNKNQMPIRTILSDCSEERRQEISREKQFTAKWDGSFHGLFLFLETGTHCGVLTGLELAL